MSGRKAGAMGLVERLAAVLAVNEIVRSRRFLGENTSKEDREELLKLTISELTSTAQVLASAVHLRQQVETAEFTRALIEQQKAAQQPPGGPGMPTKKKRLTQREKAERAAIKKQLQADGVLPPDKPRLNRKKFAREVWEDFSEMDVYTADFYLRKAIMATVGPEMHEVTSEQVGVLKLMKLAVETDRFMQQLKTEGREQYSIGEYVEKVYNPVMNL